MNTTETKMIAIRETLKSGKKAIWVGVAAETGGFHVMGRLAGKRAERAAGVVIGWKTRPTLELIGCRQTWEDAQRMANATIEGRAIRVMDAVEGVSIAAYMNGTEAVA